MYWKMWEQTVKCNWSNCRSRMCRFRNFWANFRKRKTKPILENWIQNIIWYPRELFTKQVFKRSIFDPLSTKYLAIFWTLSTRYLSNFWGSGREVWLQKNPRGSLIASFRTEIEPRKAWIKPNWYSTPSIITNAQIRLPHSHNLFS